MNRAPLLTAGMMTLLACVGCGGGSPAPTPPPDGKSIVSLSDAERGLFCTDLASIEGGYSKPLELTCEGGTSTVTFSIGNNQMSCTNVFMALPMSCASLTVGQVRSCVTDTYAETCDSAGTSPPSCDAFFACLVAP